MKIEVITPDSMVFAGEVEYVRFPGSKGSFAVLRNHAPIISTLERGDIEIREENGEERFISIEGGVVEVKNNKIIVLAEIL